MSGRGKNYREASAQIDRLQLYEPREALRLVKDTSYASFDETVETHFRLGVDPRHADQQVRGVVMMPHGLGKVVRVLVFAAGEADKIAQEAGADYVANDDEWMKKIQDGWTDFDVAIAVPEMMGKVGRLGRVLGPRGLMPNAKTGTVTFDVARAINDLKAGKIDFRAEKAGIVHAPMGKVSFGVDKIVQNMTAFFDTIMRLKPASSKGTYLKGIAISTTMGPGVKIDLTLVKDLLK